MSEGEEENDDDDVLERMGVGEEKDDELDGESTRLDELHAPASPATQFEKQNEMNW